MANNLKYMSRDFSVETPTGLIEHETPLLPDLREILVFRQKFMQLSDYYVSPNFNEPSTVISAPTAYCCGDTIRQDVGGRCVRWERTWARVPDSYEKAGGIYRKVFPGLSAAGRDPTEWPVRVTVVRDFFLCGDFGVFAQWQDIPVNKAFQPYEDGDVWRNTDILDDTTTPTEADYIAMIVAGTPVLLEDSKVYPWFGSVYVREELYAPAS